MASWVVVVGIYSSAGHAKCCFTWNCPRWCSLVVTSWIGCLRRPSHARRVLGSFRPFSDHWLSRRTSASIAALEEVEDLRMGVSRSRRTDAGDTVAADSLQRTAAPSRDDAPEQQPMLTNGRGIYSSRRNAVQTERATSDPLPGLPQSRGSPIPIPAKSGGRGKDSHRASGSGRS